MSLGRTRGAARVGSEHVDEDRNRRPPALARCPGRLRCPVRGPFHRPGPPAKVWAAFLLGAASISLLGAARAPFGSLLAISEAPWTALALHVVFGVAAPEEIVKILVIVAVSWRRQPFADPMDTVVYGAAAGLGFAAYENLAYLVQHP